MVGKEKPWRLTPSGLWETQSDPHGRLDYRCTECFKVSPGFLPSPRKMHARTCDRLVRGERGKPLPGPGKPLPGKKKPKRGKR